MASANASYTRGQSVHQVPSTKIIAQWYTAGPSSIYLANRMQSVYIVLLGSPAAAFIFYTLMSGYDARMSTYSSIVICILYLRMPTSSPCDLHPRNVRHKTAVFFDDRRWLGIASAIVINRTTTFNANHKPVGILRLREPTQHTGLTHFLNF